MHKAYDRVEWSFLKEIMLRLGFRQEWVNFIMQCVSTVEYRVRINGEESESFKLLGNVVISKKFLCTHRIMVMHSNERGECVHVPS